MVSFEDLNLTQLKQIIRAYNLITKIRFTVKKVKRNREELINDIKKHLFIDNDGFIKFLENNSKIEPPKVEKKQVAKVEPPKVEKKQVAKVEVPKVESKVIKQLVKSENPFNYIQSTTENEYEFVQALKEYPEILDDASKVFKRSNVREDNVDKYISRIEHLFKNKPTVVVNKDVVREIEKSIKEKEKLLKAEEKDLLKEKKKGSKQAMMMIENNIQQLKDEIEDLKNSIKGSGSGKPYGLHVVIFKKPYDLNDAKVKAQEFIKDKKKKYYRETSTSFRFRNISKQKFKPKTFRTKKINENISLIFGELKPEFASLKGTGLMDNVLTGFLAPKLASFYNKGFEEIKNPIAIKNSDKVPDTKTAYQMVDNAYERRSTSVGDWKPFFRSDSMIAYKKINGNVIILALRGTEIKKAQDLIADIKIAVDKLTESQRFKKDVLDIKKIQKTYSRPNYYYVALGHSLSGAIIDELLNMNLIDEGLSFNPAIQKKDYLKNLKHRRIYIDTDPLHQLLGKYAKYREVRKSGLPIEKAHSLSNFTGGFISGLSSLKQYFN